MGRGRVEITREEMRREVEVKNREGREIGVLGFGERVGGEGREERGEEKKEVAVEAPIVVTKKSSR